MEPGKAMTNVVVIDAKGVARVKHNGTIDQPTMDKLVKTVQELLHGVQGRLPFGSSGFSIQQVLHGTIAGQVKVS